VPVINWPEYNRMIRLGFLRSVHSGERLYVDYHGKQVRVRRGQGDRFGSSPRWHDSRPYRVVIRDPDHPITRGIPRAWMHAPDQFYDNMRGPIENLHLLATARSLGKVHEPVMWTVTYGKGRVFNTPMGHDLTAMRCLGFRTALARGTEWAATGKVTLPIPPNFPTADKTSSAPPK
jgi:type 1 glutamine amidotransferase